MKILKMKVKWNEGLGNSPELQVLVNRIPESDEMIYEHKDGLYFAERTGYVRFYAVSHSGNGFGGREFKLKMKDGKEVTLKGPWSSRSAIMNQMGFTHSMEVHITDNPEKYERGYFMSGNITMLKVFDYLTNPGMTEELGKVFIIEVHDGKEFTWYPSMDEDIVMKPSEKEKEFENSNFDNTIEEDPNPLEVLFESEEAKEHIKEMADNMKKLNATQARVVKDNGPPYPSTDKIPDGTDVVCNATKECDNHSCKHGEVHARNDETVIAASGGCDGECSAYKKPDGGLCIKKELVDEDTIFPEISHTMHIFDMNYEDERINPYIVKPEVCFMAILNWLISEIEMASEDQDFERVKFAKKTAEKAMEEMDNIL